MNQRYGNNYEGDHSDDDRSGQRRQSQQSDDRTWNSSGNERNQGYGMGQRSQDESYGGSTRINQGQSRTSGYAESQGTDYGREGSGNSPTMMEWQGRRDYQGSSGSSNRSFGSGDYGRQSQRYSSGEDSSNQQGYGGQNFNRQSQTSFGRDQEYGQGSGQGFTSQNYGQQSQSSGMQSGRSYRGMGPKGYTRSDERLKEDISEKLMENDEIDASDVTIECREGVVTLEGTVNERRLKHRIEDIVEQCHGVKDIENRLTVKRDGQSQSSRGKSSSSENRSSASADDSSNESSSGTQSKKKH